ncbi:DUF488 domain-containing protein [Desertibacillus haloalkaliphilus]|uniref:DUF488 domain-containing protein n=1 Tax=Desertibacillus haloalkaliphilus TaxID=1328930 RepID=UPI001C2651DE|nr:DUF488 family protein [Desertibacillus haloalkaliphilus]MBU8908728.1 DUF488 family protein [Desertibacillus haloalkaliphilus]
MSVQTKRAYEDIAASDGIRVLVDRIWPRGISKSQLAINFWYKDIAPSTDLRKWFNHDPEKYPIFKERYKQELKDDSLKNQKLLELKSLVRENKQVTLVYGAKDRNYNQAEVLKELLSDS